MQKIFHFFLVLFFMILILIGCAPARVIDSDAEQVFTKAIPTSIPMVMVTPTRLSTSTPFPTETKIPLPTAISTTVIAFTGVIVPARCVQAEIDRRGEADYIYQEVREILTNADIAVGTYNAVISDQVEMVGCENSWELVGSPANADSLQRAGFDVMSVATNHIMDCGKNFCGTTAFFDTLYHLDRVGISSVGAGQNLTEAMRPAVIEVRGIRFGFVSLGEVNERVFADEITPGIAVLTLNNLSRAIQQAQEVADVVIVLPHSGPEDYPEVTPQQKYWARHAVEFGADLVVTTHAHILQGHERISEVPVFYSLGNFVFDQIWARDHQQGAVLLVTFEGKTIIGFEIIPTIVAQDGTVHLASGAEKDEILERIEGLSADLREVN